MSRTRATTRRTTTALAAAAIGLGALVPAGVASAAPAPKGGHGHHHSHQGPHGPQRGLDRVALPDGFQPEGIATRGTTAYLGSRADGDLYRTDLRTGKGRVFSQGQGTPSLGLKIDERQRLFVSGGSGGDFRVVDARSGKVLRSYTLETGTAFINDVVLTKRAAYVTDSANAQLFELPLGPRGELPTQAQVRRIPLGGAWQQVEGNNANGITTTPDGRALLVINSTSGILYRVDARTGRATAVDTGGYSLANGDGMLREGDTLYVVQNRDNKIAVLRLDRSGTTARKTGTITSPRFDVPSTVARSGDSLYLPNARFTTPATPTTTYDVTRVTAKPGPGDHPRGPKPPHGAHAPR